MKPHIVFQVGQRVYWATRAAHTFTDPISASRFPSMEFVGAGPFLISTIEDSDPSSIDKTEHPQIVTIETPVGSRRMSGWWFRPTDSPPWETE
jgi:hypothetical protein